MTRLVCFFLGHIWNGWNKQTGAFAYGDEYRECLSCRKYETRFVEFSRKFAIGETIKVKFPKQYLIRDGFTILDVATAPDYPDPASAPAK